MYHNDFLYKFSEISTCDHIHVHVMQTLLSSFVFHETTQKLLSRCLIWLQLPKTMQTHLSRNIFYNSEGPWATDTTFYENILEFPQNLGQDIRKLAIVVSDHNCWYICV